MDLPQVQPSPILSFAPIIILSIGFSIIAGLLAKDKGRNILLWVILGLIPIVNFWCMPYIVGASNLRLERKLDALMTKLENLNP